MNTNKPQTWYIGTAVVAVLVLLAGWFLLVAPAKSNAADLSTQADGVVAQNAATQVQIDQLKAQSKNLPAQEAQIAAIRTRIPTTPALPTLIRTLSTQATAAGVSLDSLTPGTPTLAAGGTATTATGNSPVAPGRVSQIPISMKVTGNFANVRLFMNGIEQMQRSMLVSGLAISLNAAGSTTTTTGSLSTTITGEVFMTTPIATTPTTTAATAAG
ncbi:MAG: type 4a pilus biogenesis protein PilO [Candidatus Nanopelagicales bacterium]